MSAEETRALVEAETRKRLERLRRASTGALEGVDELVNEFIARHEGAQQYKQGMEAEVAEFRRQLQVTLLGAMRALDAHFGGQALSRAPSPLDDEEGV